MRSYDHWFAGVPVSGGGASIQRRFPAHGRLLAEFRAGTKADIDAAVGVARRAFELPGGWPRMPSMERAAVLQRLAGLMEKNAEWLATIEAEEVGKPIRFARGEVAGAVGLTRYAAALAWQLNGKSSIIWAPTGWVS